MNLPSSVVTLLKENGVGKDAILEFSTAYRGGDPFADDREVFKDLPEFFEEWRRVFGKYTPDMRLYRLPSARSLPFQFGWESLEFIKKHHKLFNRLVAVLGEDGSPVDYYHLPALLRCIWQFGEKTEQWIAYCGDLSSAEVDCEVKPDFISWFWPRRKGTSVSDAKRILTDWIRISEGQDLRKLSFHQAKERAFMAQYTNSRSPEFAAVAAQVGVSLDNYSAWEMRWLAASRQDNLPHISVIHEGYRGYMLDKDDPRGLFLGELTHCCQHPGGVGESCAWYGTENPDSGFFVVERRGVIVAQSWCWVDGDTFVFDNIEQLSEGYNAVIEKVYLQAIEQLPHDRVLIGRGYDSTVWVESYPSLLPGERLVFPKGYTDAEDASVIRRGHPLSYYVKWRNPWLKTADEAALQQFPLLYHQAKQGLPLNPTKRVADYEREAEDAENRDAEILQANDWASMNSLVMALEESQVSLDQIEELRWAALLLTMEGDDLIRGVVYFLDERHRDLDPDAAKKAIRYIKSHAVVK